MIELYRDRDYTRVGYFQTVLESEGIPTFVRNEHIVTMMTEVPIPDLFPALCVMDEGDYDRGLEILRGLLGRETQIPDAEPDPQEGPIRTVFVIGITVIFGLIALWAAAPILGALIDGEPLSYGFLAGGTAVALGSLWIIWITVRRWRLAWAHHSSS